MAITRNLNELSDKGMDYTEIAYEEQKRILPPPFFPTWRGKHWQYNKLGIKDDLKSNFFSMSKREPENVLLVTHRGKDGNVRTARLDHSHVLSSPAL